MGTGKPADEMEGVTDDTEQTDKLEETDKIEEANGSRNRNAATSRYESSRYHSVPDLEELGIKDDYYIWL